jgi:hypothetical protein
MSNKARPKNKTARSGVPLAVQAMEGTFAPKRIPTADLHKQLAYRAAGNPPGTLPTTAISNCFPGLEVDFRNVWKRLFEGIELHESDNLVVGWDQDHEALRLRRLVRIHLPDGGTQPIIIRIHGPDTAGPDADLGNQALEWGNALAYVVQAAGQTLTCDFTKRRAPDQVPFDTESTEAFPLRVRPFFEPGTVVVARELLGPGDLTQSLCSPWQNDYRECACYYWAASRPDYVNVEAGPAGTSIGENWMQPRGTEPKQYQVDDFTNEGVFTYQDIFARWENVLRFEIQGQDSD